jgi:beta-glucosidase
MTVGTSKSRAALVPGPAPLSILLCVLLGLLLTSATAPAAPEETPWTDPPAMAPFIDALLERMTLEEKAGQLGLFTSDWSVTGPTVRESYRDDVRAGRVGAIFNAYTADFTRELQKLAVEETRLGIPLLFGYDVIHGHRSIFPIPLGEAASWDLGAIEQSARVAATEASADGLHWTFAPMVDVARDARWGRVSEGAGEDVYLNSKIAAARVRGFQGDDLAAVDTVLATAKHYAAYGAAQAGRDYHTTDMSDRVLREVYLPPFKAAVDAGVATVMTAFNEVNGIPASGNEYLIADILREEWGFDGFVVSDYTSINEMVPHGYARDLAHAGELAIDAGVDMDLQGAVFTEYLVRLVREGQVSPAQVETAARRILEMKYRLGLFDDPYRYSDNARQAAEIYKPEHLEATRDMARRSMVLLKNEDRTLPLAPTVGTVALIGPLADSEADMIGSWSAAGERSDKPVTVREALAARFGDSVQVEYARGAGYDFDDAGDTSGFAEALAAARAADVVVAVMGERWDMSGEAASRTSLELPGAQQALLEALVDTGKPVILVLMNGRPLALEWADEHVPALLEAWYPGTMGGHAVVDVLFGDYNPSGKLPVSFPRNVGQLPLHYDMKNTGRPWSPDNPEQKYLSRYLDTPNSPLYPFGYGLSYTSFALSDVELDAGEIDLDDTLTASVTVTNTGDRAGEEVVQLYIRDLVGSVTRPVKELKDFEKIRLEQGASRRVAFELDVDDLSFYRADMTFGAEPGDFEVFIGTSSDDTKSARFSLRGAAAEERRIAAR